MGSLCNRFKWRVLAGDPREVPKGILPLVEGVDFKIEFYLDDGLGGRNETIVGFYGKH